MSDDLVAFLRARYDEDEQIALAVDDNSAPGNGQWETDGDNAIRTHNGWVLAYGHTSPLRPGFAVHVALHDPARVLAEVVAKRAILDVHVDRAECTRCEWFDDELYPCDTLKLLGSPYARHEGYRKEWTP